MAREHRATFSRCKRTGGWLVRVQGPHAQVFAGRDVPVSKRDGAEQSELLDSLLWSGTDTDTGEPVALYSFVPTEKTPPEDVTF